MPEFFNAILAIIFLVVFVMFFAASDDVIDVGQLRKKLSLDNFSPLGIIKNKVNDLNLEGLKNDFDQVFESLKATKNDIIRVINKLLPNFNHIDKGKNLDSKM